MQLGVMVEGQEGLTWAAWRAILARAEALGFESVWRSDHFCSRLDPRREAPRLARRGLALVVELVVVLLRDDRRRPADLAAGDGFEAVLLLAPHLEAEVLAYGRVACEQALAHRAREDLR